MFPEASPLAALSLIVAPAIITNASSVLIMSTSNRLARAVDRATQLARELEGAEDPHSRETARRMRELRASERRSFMLLRALRSFYLALSGFAGATLLSLVAALVELRGPLVVARVLEVLAVGLGTAAVTGLVYGSILLVHETRVAVGVLRARARRVRSRIRRSNEPC